MKIIVPNNIKHSKLFKIHQLRKLPIFVSKKLLYMKKKSRQGICLFFTTFLPLFPYLSSIIANLIVFFLIHCPFLLLVWCSCLLSFLSYLFTITLPVFCFYYNCCTFWSLSMNSPEQLLFCGKIKFYAPTKVFKRAKLILTYTSLSNTTLGFKGFYESCTYVMYYIHQLFL